MTAQRLAVAFALAVLAGPARAGCPAEDTTVLSCLARGGAKSITLCIAGDTIRYAYGARGAAPELALSAPLTSVAHQPWNGVGRSIWEATTLVNGAYSYEVFISVDRLVEGHPASGGVAVLQGERVVAQVDCDPGSEEIGLWAVSDAFAARGLCWDPARHVWGACDG